jgi:ATP-dependent RNA helicase RhlB
MKRTAEDIGYKLAGNNIPAEVLTGDIDQKKRLKIIDRMKDGQLSILVATDVAARGLHIDDVSHVVNYDLPADAANYVHRIGRTARAGASGVAYTLACEDLVANLPPIERYIDMKIEVGGIDFELEKDETGGSRRPRGRRPGAGAPSGGGKRQDFQRKSKPFRGSHPSEGGRGRGGEEKGRHYDERPKSPSGPKSHKPRHSSAPGGRPSAKPSKQMSQEDRMELYRKKYGDSFGKEGAERGDGHHAKKPHDSHKKHAHQDKKHETAGHPHKSHKPADKKHDTHGAEPVKKKGILRKIFGVFRGKGA